MALTTYNLYGFHSGGKTIKARGPIVLTIVKNRCVPPDYLIRGPWGLSAFGRNPDDLVADILEELDVMWRNYAKEDDANLTDAAQTIKKELLESFEEG